MNDNNILIVSEQEQVAYLPYYYDKVEDIYTNNKDKYTSIQEAIKDLYIVPLDAFKYAPIARFREALNLILHRDNGSIFKALDLGIELMFNYRLNPIVIAACRNLDELDIYLDCLAENELRDYKCFEIRFEVPPVINDFGVGGKNHFKFRIDAK